RPAALDVMRHHLGDAPQNALAEPAGDHAIAGAGAVQQVAVARYDAARAGEPFSAGADQRPDHAHRRARHRAAADADRVAVAHERCRLLQRYHLLAQASVAPSNVVSQLRVRSYPTHKLLPAGSASGRVTLASALNSRIRLS